MFWRGTGKAEAAKLQGAGISPKLCPRKGTAETGKRIQASPERGGAVPGPGANRMGVVADG